MNKERMSEPGEVRLECKRAVGVVTLANPPMNLLSRLMLERLGKLVLDLDARRSVRVIVIRGAGSQLFTAGADLQEISAALHVPNTEIQQRCLRWLKAVQQTLLIIEAAAKPVIVTMKGISFGGGMELAAACDLRVAAATARFSLPEARLGLLPGYGGTQRLARLIGPGRAKHLILTAREMNAQEAYAAGFVDVLCTAGHEDEAALALAEQISQKGPLAIGAIKQAVNRGMNLDLQAGLELEQQLFAHLATTEDCLEGVHAFLSKRSPEFKGR